MSSQQQSNNHINQVNTTDSARRLCDKGCGFYGSLTTSNLWLCSQCYRKHCKTQPSLIVDFRKLSINESSSSSSNSIDASTGDGRCTEKNRCSSCRKRVGLMGFNCRCGNTFCSVHRYAEEHGCTFNYRGTARNSLAKANPGLRQSRQVTENLKLF